jgi:S1-C subfamily serine protease
VATLFAVCSSSFPAAAIVGGASPADGEMLRHVVLIVGSNDKVCSGVVIAEDLILTVAQCVPPGVGYKLVRFNRTTLQLVASVTLHPQYDSNAILKHRVTADVALLKLAAPLPRGYVPVALAEPRKVIAVGDRVMVAGYGVATFGDNNSLGTLRAAPLVVTGATNTLQIRLVDPNTRGEIDGLGGCNGDSGAPVFDTSGSRLAVIGMVSWSTGPALSVGCGGLTGVTPLARYRDWIIKTAAAMGSPLSPELRSGTSEEPPTPAQNAIRLPPWATKRPTMPSNYGSEDLSAQQVFRTVASSVYLIIAGQTAEAINGGDGYIGSAVAISPDTALTNCHIVENQKYIAVLDEATTQPLKSVVASADQSSDRCFLRVQGKLNSIAAVRRFRDLVVGERVYTIGNPSGLTKTLGEGLISGLRQRNGIRYVQTTAQISRGSSGGALVDSKGYLVGITTFLLKDAQNLNFAIAAEEYWR